MAKLFDGVFSAHESNQPFTHAEGFAGVLVAVIASDGHIAQSELDGLFTILRRMKLYGQWHTPEFDAMMSKLTGILQREGVDALLKQSSAALPIELSETVFCCAADLVLADGVVDPAEKEMLTQLMKILGISGDKGLTVVEVMVMKNRG